MFYNNIKKNIMIYLKYRWNNIENIDSLAKVL